MHQTLPSLLHVLFYVVFNVICNILLHQPSSIPRKDEIQAAGALRHTDPR